MRGTEMSVFAHGTAAALATRPPAALMGGGSEGAGVAAGWQFERLQPRAGTGGGSAHGARGGYAQIPDTAPPDVPPGI